MSCLPSSTRASGGGEGGRATRRAGRPTTRSCSTSWLGGEAEPEPRRPVARFGADAPAGRLDELAGDRQADTRAAGGAIAGLLDPVEAVGDGGGVGRRGGPAGVCPREEHAA